MVGVEKEAIQLVVGLGNPGAGHAEDRHNVGFWLVDAVAESLSVDLKTDGRSKGQLALCAGGLRLLKPQTFMNLSGQSVAACAHYFRIPPTNIVVVHDELDIDAGSVRLKRGGGHGGHNGLRDIISCMANNKEFYRLRIGIDHPGHRDRVTGHVLGKAPANEQNLIDQAIDEAARCFEIWQKDDIKKAQNRLHSFKAQ